MSLEKAKAPQSQGLHAMGERTPILAILATSARLASQTNTTHAAILLEQIAGVRGDDADPGLLPDQLELPDSSPSP